MSPMAIRMIFAGVALVGGGVLGFFYNDRILAWTARATRGSGWRASALLAGYLLSVLFLDAVVILVAVVTRPTRLAWLGDAVTLVIALVMFAVSGPFASDAHGRPLTATDELKRAGGRGKVPRVLGIGGAFLSPLGLMSSSLMLLIGVVIHP